MTSVVVLVFPYSHRALSEKIGSAVMERIVCMGNGCVVFFDEMRQGSHAVVKTVWRLAPTIRQLRNKETANTRR